MLLPTTTTKQRTTNKKSFLSLAGTSGGRRSSAKRNISNNRDGGGLFSNSNSNNNSNFNFKRAVHILVATVLISLFGSNLLLLMVQLKIKNKVDHADKYNPPAVTSPSSVATAVAASSQRTGAARGSRRRRQEETATAPSASNCILRRYPPHRYYKLDNEKQQQQQPDFLTVNDVEYVFGEWPIVLKWDGAPDNAGGATKKLCVRQEEWRKASRSLPFADGTNPSILSIERIRKEGNSGGGDSSLTKLVKAYPNARYVATACMTNTQCSWNDSSEDRDRYRISNQTKPDVVLTVLLVLDANFNTLAQSQLLLERDATWGLNKRKRLNADASKLHRPQLDDARLFVHDRQVWLSYREGGLFGYETQVLNPLHYDIVDKGKEAPVLRAWLKSSETSSFCCGRNMALMQLPPTTTNSNNNADRLQSLTWVDPVTVIDVDTTPLRRNVDTEKAQRRRKLMDLVGDEAAAEEEEEAHQQLHRRLLKKKKKSHVHGTNGFMVYLPQPHNVFLGVAHIHRPHDRNSNPYARHGHHYTHAFFTISSSKPYQLKSLSQEFVLPSIVNPNDAEIIQFLSGLEVVYDNNNNNNSNGRIVIAYGINDCEAAVTTVSLSYVLEKLLRPVEAGKEVVDYMEPLKQQK